MKQGKLETGYPTSLTAMVTYEQPNFDEIQRRFDWTSRNFRNQHFVPIYRCKQVSREPRMVAFEIFKLDRDASVNEVLGELERQGLRPALYEELLSVVQTHPEIGCLVALGSVSRGVDAVGTVQDHRGTGILQVWIGAYMGASNRFLAVRE